MTLAPEESVVAERGVSYLYADLRDLPLRSAYYDTVVSILTLEHVGKETTRYGVTGDAEPDPRPSLMAAVRELKDEDLAAAARAIACLDARIEPACYLRAWPRGLPAHVATRSAGKTNGEPFRMPSQITSSP